jgi:CO/xanthine dehydrogenase Mo-binding subunit
MPYRLPRLEPGGPAVDTECNSGDYCETLERCLAEFGWEEKRALQSREIDGRYHGVAVACFIEGGGAGPKETARLEVEADGTVSVYVGSTAVGQGLETVMAQIAADTLGRPESLTRDRWFADSPLEGAGFEPSVPRRAVSYSAWYTSHDSRAAATSRSPSSASSSRSATRRSVASASRVAQAWRDA